MKRFIIFRFEADDKFGMGHIMGHENDLEAAKKAVREDWDGSWGHWIIKDEAEEGGGPDVDYDILDRVSGEYYSYQASDRTFPVFNVDLP